MLEIIEKQFANMNEKFIQHVFDQSEKIEVEELNREAIHTGLHELESNGFMNSGVFIIQSGEDYPTGENYGRFIHQDPHIPEGKMLMIHEDAIAKTIPQDWRPWILKLPKGSIVIEEKR